MASNDPFLDLYIYSLILPSCNCNIPPQSFLMTLGLLLKNLKANPNTSDRMLSRDYYYGRRLLIQSRACQSVGMKSELQREHQSPEWIITGHMGGFIAFVAGFNPRPSAITTLLMMGAREKTRLYQHKGKLYVRLARWQLGQQCWLNNALTSGLHEEYMRRECWKSNIKEHIL